MVEARRLMVALGREPWGQSTQELASVRDKSADTVSFLTREGVRHRLEDNGFVLRYEALDAEMIELGRQTTVDASAR